MEAMREETGKNEIVWERAQSEGAPGRPRGAATARSGSCCPPRPPPWRWGTTRPCGTLSSSCGRNSSAVCSLWSTASWSLLTERDVVAGGRHAARCGPGAFAGGHAAGPECLHLDDALVYAFHQMHRGACRHVPMVDEQRRPTALVSMRAIIDELVAAFPQELLNLPPSPAARHRPHA